MSPFEKDLSLLIRSRYPIIYLSTLEEDRSLKTLENIARSEGRELRTWRCTSGLSGSGGATTDLLAALGQISKEAAKPSLFMLYDVHPYLENPMILRKLRDLAELLKTTQSALFLVSPSPLVKVPEELADEIWVVDYPLPAISDLSALMDRTTSNFSDRVRLTPSGRERLLESLLGLTEKAAERVILKAFLAGGELNENDISLIQSEKKQILRRTGILEYYTSGETLEDVGGLDVLKKWLKKRGDAFSEEARAYCLPSPRGLILFGVQGCGKSLVAKAVANLWRLPLLRLDIGSVFGGLVGESESKIRQAISVAESLSPCILWIDELDKAFAGVRGYQGDSGTQNRVFATFITWLQEKKKPVFVVATANNPGELPPELLRRGRFDEIFFVDLPGKLEIEEIFQVHLARRQRDPLNYDLKSLAKQCEGMSGAEIEQVIIDALFEAFTEKDTLKDEHLTAMISGDKNRDIEPFVPLSSLMKEDIESLRSWARGRARWASRQAPPEIPPLQAASGRRIEV
ncbi:MAG: AAA family ATPase [Chloroflexi bacterium]|nr:AAA family ATPase [Chloroflexota bacterium]